MKNKHIGKIIIFYILMFASSFGGIIEDLLRNDYDYDYAMGYGLLISLVNTIIVSLVMMIFPFICRVINKTALTYKTGKRICLWNSIALFTLSCVLMSFMDIGFIGGIGAIFFYFINKWIFVENPSSSKEESKKKPIPCESQNAVIENSQQFLNFDIDKMSPEEAAEYLIAEQLGEKYTPKVEQDKKTKIKYCSHCGSQIDPVTKKCTGCDKQYFKGVSAKALLCILLSCVLIASLVSNVILYIKYDEKKDECEEYKDKPTYIVTNDNEEFLDYWSQNHNKVDFVDEFVVMVEDDGTNLYHKYECSRFIGESFWVFNVDAAKAEGYKPCPKCCK